MKIPTDEERAALLAKYETPENIIRHMNKVAQVTRWIATRLKEKGVDINVDLAFAAASMHDIAKARSKGSEKSHEELGQELVTENGFPEVGNVIRHHGFQSILDKELNTWEEKALCYADKRVLHDQIVTLDERFEDGKKRYPDESGRRDEGERNSRELERELCNAMSIDPNDLKQLVENE